LEVQRAAPVVARTAAGIEAAIDAAGQGAAESGRVEARHVAASFRLDETRAFLAGQPGFAGYMEVAVVRLALRGDPAQASCIGNEGRARIGHGAGDDTAGIDRPIQVAAQGGQLAAVDAPVHAFAGRAETAVQVDRV